MSLPSPGSIESSMSYGFQGQPFVNVPSNSRVNLNNMSYSFQAQPFVSNPASTTQIPNGNVAAKALGLGMI
jgi:hypothetical protein